MVAVTGALFIALLVVIAVTDIALIVNPPANRAFCDPVDAQTSQVPVLWARRLNEQLIWLGLITAILEAVMICPVDDFSITTVPVTKPLPVTVTGIGPLLAPLFGEMDAIDKRLIVNPL